jgi:hypothetical protein
MAAGKLSPAKPHLTNPVPLSTTSGFSVIPDAVYPPPGEGLRGGVARIHERLRLKDTSKRNIQKKPFSPMDEKMTFLFWKKKMGRFS